MSKLERNYDSECTDCGDRNLWEFYSWINGMTRNQFAGRNYLDLQTIEWKFKEITKTDRLTKCNCDCVFCNKAHDKDDE